MVTKNNIEVWGQNENGKYKLEGAELDLYLADTLEHNAKLAELNVEAENKAKAKAAAQVKLAALGLSVEDLTALGL